MTGRKWQTCDKAHEDGHIIRRCKDCKRARQRQHREDIKHGRKKTGLTRKCKDDVYFLPEELDYMMRNKIVNIYFNFAGVRA